MKNDNNLRAVLEQLFSASFEPVVSTSGDNLIVVANGAFVDLVGQEVEELEGKNILELLEKSELLESIQERLEACHQWIQAISLVSRSGTEVTFDLKVNQLPDGERLWIFNSNSKYDRNRDAQFDRLTGLPSQFLFDDRAEQAVITSNRHGKSIAILRMGIDHFNRI
ncbi:MAG: PAS domain S-box protein, partial [Gammaproteobacteria bacterium]|nr:PAS domain S-box protein [Gammaproteobacteria bacterium]